MDASVYTKDVQRAVSAAVLSTVQPQQLAVSQQWCRTVHLGFKLLWLEEKLYMG